MILVHKNHFYLVRSFKIFYFIKIQRIDVNVLAPANQGYKVTVGLMLNIEVRIAMLEWTFLLWKEWVVITS